jgi:hypothetical protein
MSLECDIAPGKVEAFEQKKAEIQEELGLLNPTSPNFGFRSQFSFRIGYL